MKIHKFLCSADYGDGVPETERTVAALDPEGAAERYVEDHHGELDYPSSLRVAVRGVAETRRPDLYEVTVSARPEASARLIAQEDD